MRKHYESPEETRLGTVHERTLMPLNKLGPEDDEFSSIVPIVGSITPI